VINEKIKKKAEKTGHQRRLRRLPRRHIWCKLSLWQRHSTKNDVLAKWIIINSLGENTKKIVEGQGKTAFQTWNILEKSYTVGPEKKKIRH